MIEFEILATLAATGLATLIIIIQIVTLRRAKLDDSIPAQTTSTAFTGKQKPIPQATQKKFSSAVFFQLIIDLAILAGFIWWTFYLISRDFIEWAALSGFFALIGMIMLFVVLRGVSKTRQAIEQPSQTQPFKNSDATIPKATQQPNAKIEPLIFDNTESKSEAVNYAATLTETGAIPQATMQKTELPKEKPAIPEDSALRRHYLTHQRYQLEARLPIRPTDSALRRHYEQLLTTELEKRLHNIIA
ncbi:MAG: hypothetical protein ACXW1W_04895 [Methylococcaceae bacterium]